MSLWPEPSVDIVPVMVSPFSGVGAGFGAAALASPTPTSQAIGAANATVAFPIYLPDTATFVKAWVVNGATVSGNLDIGLYDETWSLITSTGSFAQAGASIMQEQDITDVTVGPGLYYLAMALSSATATFQLANSNVLIAVTSGSNYMLTAFPLPAVFAPAAFLNGLALFGLSQRSLVA